MRKITKFLKWLSCKVFYRVKIHNEEVLDKYDSYLICPNHSCIFDPAFVFPAKYDRDIYIVAKKELFKHLSFRWLAKTYNVFPVDRENVDIRSMLKSFDVFKKNDKAKLILFPEGKVIKDESEVGNVFKKGAAFMALHLDKPIIPVYITRRPKLFQRIDVFFGKPILISEQKFESGNKIENISKELIKKIYELREDNNE